jgi:hypothetical protein
MAPTPRPGTTVQVPLPVPGEQQATNFAVNSGKLIAAVILVTRHLVSEVDVQFRPDARRLGRHCNSVHRLHDVGQALMPIEEHRKTVYERLDAVYAAIASPYGDDAGQQEFVALLTDIARGSRDEKMWDMIKDWAKKRS